jgi:hypothetical protein
VKVSRGGRSGSYVQDFRGSGGGTLDPDTTVVEMSDGSLFLTLSAPDSSDKVQVTLSGPRGGTLGTFPVDRESLGDLLDAVLRRKMHRKAGT